MVNDSGNGVALSFCTQITIIEPDKNMVCATFLFCCLHEDLNDITPESNPSAEDDVCQARSQTGAMGAIAPSAGPIAPSGASLHTLCTWGIGLAIATALPCGLHCK